MFFWYYQMLLTNCFIVYKKYMPMHTQKQMTVIKGNCIGQSLAPDGALRWHMQQCEHRWTVINEDKKGPRYQLHYLANDLKHRTKLMFYQICEVILCFQCIIMFHTVEDLVGKNLQIWQQHLCDKLCAKMQNEEKQQTWCWYSERSQIIISNLF